MQIVIAKLTMNQFGLRDEVYLIRTVAKR